METLKYAEARELIQDGDIVSVKPCDYNPVHLVVCWVTKKPFYHTAIALWMYSTGGTKRLFVCEAHRSGRRLVPMSKYESNEMVVKCAPLPFAKIEESLLSRVGFVPYAFWDLIVVGVRILFGRLWKDSKAEICSELAQDIYSEAGFTMPDYVLSPGELDSYLESCGVPDRVLICK